MLKRGQVMLVFLLLWTTSLVVSVSMVYGGVALSISYDEPIDVVSEGTVTIRSSVVGDVGAGSVIPAEGQLSVSVFISYIIDDLKCYLKDSSGIVIASDLTVEREGRSPSVTHSFDIYITGIVSQDTDVFLSFDGDWYDYKWVGNTFMFTLDFPDGISPDPTTTVPPTTLPDTTPTALPEDVDVVIIGMVFMVVLVHIIVLPIGALIIRKVVRQ